MNSMYRNLLYETNQSFYLFADLTTQHPTTTISPTTLATTQAI